LLLGLILILFMPETGFRPRERSQGRRAAFWQTLRDSRAMLQKRPVLFNILLIGFVFGAFSEGYDRLWVANLSQNIGLPALNTPLGTFDPVVWFGIIRVTGMLLGLLGTSLVETYLDMSQLPLIVRALRLLTGVLFLALVTLSFSQSFWLAFLAICIIGMMRNTIEPLYKAWINQGLESSVRATVFSMAGQADAIGQLAGGPGIGAIATVTSMGLGMFISSLLLSPALWLFGRSLRAEKASQTYEIG
jgi:MFS transporter, DHA3 family, tetracycline resistance protein